MLRYQKSVALPSAGQLRDEQFDAIIRSNPITESACAPLKLPEKFRLKLEEAWLKQRTPKNLNDFKVELDLHPSCRGFVFLFARYYGTLQVGVRLELEWDEERDPDPPDDIVIEAADVKPEHDEKFWDEIWSAFHPVQTLQAEPTPRPNDRCPCGSNFKYKKCCGR